MDLSSNGDWTITAPKVFDSSSSMANGFIVVNSITFTVSGFQPYQGAAFACVNVRLIIEDANPDIVLENSWIGVGDFDNDQHTVSFGNNEFIIPHIDFEKKSVQLTPYFNLTAVGSFGGSGNCGSNSTPATSNNAYFSVTPPDIAEVNDFDFVLNANSSPLTEVGQSFSITTNWQQVSNPTYGTPDAGIQIDRYRTFFDLNEIGVIESNSPLNTTFSFLQETDPAFYKKREFALKSEDDVRSYGYDINDPSIPPDDGNLSDFGNRCYVYDSGKKGSSASSTPQITSTDDLTPVANSNFVFTGWFEIPSTKSFIVDANKVYLEEMSRITVKSNANFDLTYQNLICDSGTEFIAESGGTISINGNTNQGPWAFNCSTTGNGMQSCFASMDGGNIEFDADIRFSDQSFLLIDGDVTVKENHTLYIGNGGLIKVYPGANLTLETGASIVVEDGGMVQVYEEMTLSELQSFNLTMETGSSYKLANNAKLTVNTGFTTDKDFELGTNAEIVVQAPFTATNSSFTSASTSKWRGFLVNSGISSLSLENCTIDNAMIGVYANGVSGAGTVSLSNSTFTNNTFGVIGRANGTNSVSVIGCDINNNTYGVYSDLNGHVLIDEYCNIDNNDIAIYTTVRGSVNARRANIHSNSNYGVNIKNEASGFFGSEAVAGLNRFYSNGSYDIFNESTSDSKEVMAQRNYWLPSSQVGSCYDNGNNCYDVDLAAITGCNPVKVQPNEDCYGSPTYSATPEQEDLIVAFEAEISKNYSLAETKFKNFLTTYPTSNYWGTALGGVVRNMEAQEKTSQVTAYLEGLILVELGEHRDTAKELLLIQYVKEERFGEASQISQELIATYTNTELELLALLEDDWLPKLTEKANLEQSMLIHLKQC